VNRDIVLLTGGNSGIGFECARRLARAGWHVLIASRDREASARAVRTIERESGEGGASELGLDLASQVSVRAVANEIESRDVPLRALVCNAGLQMNRGPILSPEGFEITFAVNHLGHFLLTNLLLAQLAENGPARIVVVASGVHDPGLTTGMPKPDITTLETLAATGGPRADAFDGRMAYVNSKLCNLWFAYELARRVEAAALSTAERPLTVNAYEPGLVPGSGLARDYPPALRLLWNVVFPGIARAVSPFVPAINSAPKSGGAMAQMLLDPERGEVTGRYFPSHTRWREGASSEASYEIERARELWEASVRMTGLTADESPLPTS
jgi:NAD(P)-dependent dehydrogenase (short-subunit alcohol dehydrogenase family)